MDILEDRNRWLEKFEAGWLAHFHQTGQTDFKQYPTPRNRTAPAGPGVDLSQSRLLFITSAGGYLPEEQEPFHPPHPRGDYTIRLFPASTPFSRLAYAPTHYDHAAIDRDPQVQLPLRHLEDLAAEGVIGELAPSVVSFMGYQPDVSRVIDELIPAIVEAAQAEQAQAALLAPA